MLVYKLQLVIMLVNNKLTANKPFFSLNNQLLVNFKKVGEDISYENIDDDDTNN